MQYPARIFVSLLKGEHGVGRLNADQFNLMGKHATPGEKTVMAADVGAARNSRRSAHGRIGALILP